MAKLKYKDGEVWKDIAPSAEEFEDLVLSSETHWAESVTDGNTPHGVVYEVGVWTPTIFGVTTAGTNTYSNQFGRYIIENNKITLFFDIRMTAKDSNMAGAIRIGGIPDFASEDTSFWNAIQYRNLTVSGGISTVSVQARTSAGHNLDRTITNGTRGGLNSSEVNDNSEFSGQITYEI